MKTANFTFHEELNYFLPPQRKHTAFPHHFNWQASIKDMIESLGVPHAEIELITVNDGCVDFAYQVSNGDVVHVYPSFEHVHCADKIRLRPPFPGKPRFVLDTHLGRLDAYLRMMGYDTLYRNDYDDDELAQVSRDEMRILLTRDIGLLKRSMVMYGYFVRNTDPRKRVYEVIQRFKLMTHVEPFKYCMKCNGLLQPVPKEDILDQISEQTAQFYDAFHRCDACQKVYWKGSHYQKMQDFMAEVRAMK
jgi:uncharacterized protein with PIN domain